MTNPDIKTAYFAASDISNHAVNSMAPMEFSPFPVFFEPTLSSTFNHAAPPEILLTYSSSRKVPNTKSVGKSKSY